MNKLFTLATEFQKRLRTWWWSHLFQSFGSGSKVSGRIKVYDPKNITVGMHTVINEGVILNARDALTIGDYCHISPGVIINTGALELDDTKDIQRAHKSSPVSIENGVWIGSGAIINPGVTLSEGCVIGAGAVVTKDIPPYAVAVGVPAVVKRYLTDHSPLSARQTEHDM